MQNMTLPPAGDFDAEDRLFAHIAEALRNNGWCAVPHALPEDLSHALHQQILAMSGEEFSPAGIGRQQDYAVNSLVRRDQIRWIEGHTAAEQAWLQWSDRLRLFLNRQLFLGLARFESHFAHYPPGAFYKKHLDAFKGNARRDATNRVLSVVAYFNPDWSGADGGNLLLFDDEATEPFVQIAPTFGTLVVFLSEDVPHEVSPARRDRYSIAGWYRASGTG